MTGGRAAASLSLTLGMAVATLLVAGGIVAGPSIVACAKSPETFGACLRAKALERGLLHDRPAPETPEPTDAATDGPHPAGWIEANAREYEPPPASSAMLLPGAGRIGADGAVPAPSAEAAAALEVARVPGGLRTGAVPPSARIDAPRPLAGRGGRLDAGASAPVPAATPDVAFAEPAGSIALAGASEPPGIATDVELGGPAGGLTARGTSSAELAAELPTRLDAPAGRMAVEALVLGSSPEARLALGERTGSVITTGSIGTPVSPAAARLAPDAGGIHASVMPPLPRPPQVANVAGDGGALSAAGSASAETSGGAGAMPAPLASPPMPPPLPGDWSTLRAALPTGQELHGIVLAPAPSAPAVAAAPPPRARPAAIEASAERPPLPPIRPVPQYDPRYPDVILLPPPNTGENSSFATLEVR